MGESEHTCEPANVYAHDTDSAGPPKCASWTLRTLISVLQVEF